MMMVVKIKVMMTQIVMLRDSGNDDVEMTATNNEGDDDDDQHGKRTMAMEGANDHDDGDHDTANGSMQ